MAARAISSATISFGLVSIPVKLYTTTESSGQISFNMLHKCGTRLKQQYWCPEDEKVVPRDEIVRGYEFAKGKYVTFTNEELKALEAESSRADRDPGVRAARPGGSAPLRAGLLPRPRQGRRQAVHAALGGDGEDRPLRDRVVCGARQAVPRAAAAVPAAA